MTRKRVIRAVVIYLLVFVGITIAWNIALRILVLPKSFIKTQARVVSLEADYPSSTGGGRQVNYLPTYSYTDDKGERRIYKSMDGFNKINGFLFKQEVGESRAAYYEKGSKEGLFVTGTGDWYTFLFAPLVFAIFPVGLIFALILFVLHKRHSSTD